MVITAFGRTSKFVFGGVLSSQLLAYGNTTQQDIYDNMPMPAIVSLENRVLHTTTGKTQPPIQYFSINFHYKFIEPETKQQTIPTPQELISEYAAVPVDSYKALTDLPVTRGHDLHPLSIVHTLEDSAATDYQLKRFQDRLANGDQGITNMMNLGSEDIAPAFNQPKISNSDYERAYIRDPYGPNTGTASDLSFI